MVRRTTADVYMSRLRFRAAYTSCRDLKCGRDPGGGAPDEDEEDEDGPALLELALHDVLLVNGPSRPKGEAGARDVCRGILCRPLCGQSRQRTAGRYPSRYKLTRAWLNMPVRDAERHWPLQAGRRKATKRWFMARGRRFRLTTPSRLRPPSRPARPVPLTSTAYTLLLG